MITSKRFRPTRFTSQPPNIPPKARTELPINIMTAAKLNVIAYWNMKNATAKYATLMNEALKNMLVNKQPTADLFENTWLNPFE